LLFFKKISENGEYLVDSLMQIGFIACGYRSPIYFSHEGSGWPFETVQPGSGYPLERVTCGLHYCFDEPVALARPLEEL
jgi:hypothetical protein